MMPPPPLHTGPSGEIYGYHSSWSARKELSAAPICRTLLAQEAVFARSFAVASAGTNSAAKVAMMVITTNNSISVKALIKFGFTMISAFPVGDIVVV